MSLTTQRKVITEYFSDNWDEGTDGVVAYPNRRFTTPSGQTFVFFDILTYTKQRASIGINTWFTRRVGAVQVDIHVPEGTGINTARAKADIVEALFESKELTTDDGEVVRFRTPNTTTLPANVQRATNIEDSFYRLIVTCEYYVDEVKTT